MRIGLKLIGRAESRASAHLILEKDAFQALRQLSRDLPEIEHVAGASGALIAVQDGKVANDEDIHREPDWPAPVRVATEEATRRFRRLVSDPIFRKTPARRRVEWPSWPLMR